MTRRPRTAPRRPQVEPWAPKTESGYRCRCRPADGVLGPLAPNVPHDVFTLEIQTPHDVTEWGDERFDSRSKSPDQRIWHVAVRKKGEWQPRVSLTTNQASFWQTTMAAVRHMRAMGGESKAFRVEIVCSSPGIARTIRGLGTKGCSASRRRRTPVRVKRVLTELRRALKHACRYDVLHLPPHTLQANQRPQEPGNRYSYVRPDEQMVDPRLSRRSRGRKGRRVLRRKVQGNKIAARAERALESRKPFPTRLEKKQAREAAIRSWLAHRESKLRSKKSSSGIQETQVSRRRSSGRPTAHPTKPGQPSRGAASEAGALHPADLSSSPFPPGSRKTHMGRPGSKSSINWRSIYPTPPATSGSSSLTRSLSTTTT